MTTQEGTLNYVRTSVNGTNEKQCHLRKTTSNDHDDASTGIDILALLDKYTKQSMESKKPKNKIIRKGTKYTTAYGYFFREHHKKFHEINPNASFSEISTQIASAWRKLHALDKQVYKNKVKKTTFSSRYGLFFRMNFKKVKATYCNATFGQISSTIARKWNSLSINEQMSYQKIK